MYRSAPKMASGNRPHLVESIRRARHMLGDDSDY
jgi:hypothetical protein